MNAGGERERGRGSLTTPRSQFLPNRLAISRLRRKQNPQPKKLHLRSSQAKPNQNPQHKPQRGLPKSIPTRPTTTRRTNLQNVFRLHRQPNPGRNHKTNLKLRGLQTLLHAKTQNPHPSRPIDTPGFESYRVFIPLRHSWMGCPTYNPT